MRLSCLASVLSAAVARRDRGGLILQPTPATWPTDEPGEDLYS